jgi:hypothetical protein
MLLVFGVIGAVALAGVFGMIAVPRLRGSREPAPPQVPAEQPRQPV